MVFVLVERVFGIIVRMGNKLDFVLYFCVGRCCVGNIDEVDGVGYYGCMLSSYFEVCVEVDEWVLIGEL